MARDDRGHQIFLGGEVAKDGALRDARPAGDVRDGRRRAVLGELRLGRGQQEFTVASRVDAKRANGGGHSYTLPI